MLLAMCKFRGICDEVTDEITDVVYLPGHPYAVASHRREVITIHTWSNVRMHTYCDVKCVMHYIIPTSQYIKYHIQTHYT